MGKAAGWWYGKAGVDGFKTAFVTDRFREGNHNVFLNAEWAETYCKPIIHDEPALITEKVRLGEGTPESLPKWIRRLAALPLNWVLLLLKLLLVAGLFSLLYTGVSSYLDTVAPVELTVLDDKSGDPIHRDFTL